MRAASHIDFRTAVKMNQQASAISGYPLLTPLPTYASQVVDECYSYSSSPDKNFDGFTQRMETNAISNSGRLTPQTPEPTIYHEPLSMSESMDHYMTSRPWPDDVMASVGLGFEPDMTTVLSTEMWSAPRPENMMPMAHMSWKPSALSVSPLEILGNDLGSHTRVIPSLTTSECSVEDFNTSGPGQDDWIIYQPIATFMDMASLATSAPFMHDPETIPGLAPTWEDIFIPNASSF